MEVTGLDRQSPKFENFMDGLDWFEGVDGEPGNLFEGNEELSALYRKRDASSLFTALIERDLTDGRLDFKEGDNPLLNIDLSELPHIKPRDIYGPLANQQTQDRMHDTLASSDDIRRHGLSNRDLIALILGLLAGNRQTPDFSPQAHTFSGDYTPGEGGVFQDALKFVKGWEGGYSNNPNDSGGPTNLGITQTTYDRYLNDKGMPPKDVKEITQAEAEEIYHTYYWKGSGADEIAKTDPKLAIAMFNTAVNCGPGRAREFLEKSGGDVSKFLQLQTQFYHDLASRRPKDQAFLNGWLNRMDDLTQKLDV